MSEFGEAGDASGANDIGTVAERLRMVRQARRKFLKLWAIDRSLIDPLVDRLAEDLRTAPPSQPAAAAPGLDPDGAASPPSPPRRQHKSADES